VPTLAGIDVHRLGGLWIPLVLVNAGCTLRVVFQTLTDFTSPAFAVAGASGLLEVAGLAIWGVHLWRLMGRRIEETPTGRQLAASDGSFIALESLDPSAPITGDQIVADVLDRHPALLETFLSFGFAPLRSAAARKTLARLVTVRQACEKLGVDPTEFLAALNAAQRGEASSAAGFRPLGTQAEIGNQHNECTLRTNLYPVQGETR